MKRSEINAIMRETKAFCAKMGFLLPPFVHWTAEDWRGKGPECAEIVQTQLGWDITDFGSGDYENIGLMMITLRNGSMIDPGYPKPYAEKALIVRAGQVTPMHYHYRKREDIINRGGGDLLMRLYNRAEDDGLAESRVRACVDGVLRELEPGETLRIQPGESVSLPSGLYHTFWGEAGGAMVLVGEVSSVNDDHTDNHFLMPTGRFPQIEEDEPPLHLLYADYTALTDFGGGK